MTLTVTLSQHMCSPSTYFNNSLGDGLQYPTLNQHHSMSTSYHSMDDTRNRLEQQPTDKLINTTTTTTDAMPSPKLNDDDHQKTIVIDMMNQDNYTTTTDSQPTKDFTSNGNIVLNMDILNANNLSTDPNQNTTVSLDNVVEVHARA